jgi:hypothetical protein
MAVFKNKVYFWMLFISNFHTELYEMNRFKFDIWHHKQVYIQVYTSVHILHASSWVATPQKFLQHEVNLLGIF